MKEYFSIGELAELFRPNIQTLYYYNSVGIFSPRERNGKNGYRKYEFGQIYELITVSYMRRLDYSLEEIRESRTSLNSSRAVDIMKQRFQKLRRRRQRLFNIDEAIQGKIRFMEQEMDGIHLDEITIKHSEDRRFIFIGDEELLCKEDSFYFYPTIVFYEGDQKCFGVYLYLDHEEISKTMSQSRIQIIRRGDLLCGYHLGGYEGVPNTIRRLKEARPDFELGTQAINFSILGQLMGNNNKNFIIATQIRVL